MTASPSYIAFLETLRHIMIASGFTIQLVNDERGARLSIISKNNVEGPNPNTSTKLSPSIISDTLNFYGSLVNIEGSRDQINAIKESWREIVDTASLASIKSLLESLEERITALESSDNISADTELDATSNHSIANSAVCKALQDKSNISHAHKIADIEGWDDQKTQLQSQISSIGDHVNQTFSDMQHQMDIQNANITSAMRGKANVSHSHAISDIVGLEDALNAAAAGTTILVDDTSSVGSKNPAQNKVITEKPHDLISDSPDATNEKAVKSSAFYAALSTKADASELSKYASSQKVDEVVKSMESQSSILSARIQTGLESKANVNHTHTPDQVGMSSYIAQISQNAADIRTLSTQQKAALSRLQEHKSVYYKYISLPATNWTNSRQVITLEGLTRDNLVICYPADESLSSYTACGVSAVSQEINKLVFACKAVPDIDLSVVVLVYTEEKQ